jgi:pSer/pThr/pTyr-binding forkhead associated (FHA) protein
LGKALHLGGRHEIDKQRERGFGDGINAHNPDPTDLQQAVNRVRRTYQDMLSHAPQLGLIIGDQASPVIDQAQREVRFSCARPAAE